MFICGPLVFSTATTQFLGPLSSNANAIGALTIIGSPLATRRGDQPAFPGEELVLVSSPFFPHKLSKGYDNPISRVVETINGLKIKNLAHLVAVLRDAKEEFLTTSSSPAAAARRSSSRARRCSRPPTTFSTTTASAPRARLTRSPSGTRSPRNKVERADLSALEASCGQAAPPRARACGFFM